MNEELDYAEMLEIPVETMTVKKREKRRRLFREEEPDLERQLVDRVNEQMGEDPNFAESRPIEREATPAAGKRSRASKILLAEFAAVVGLCAAIFLTNIFLPESAINTFVRGLFVGNAEAVDERVYSDFTLSPVVNEYVDAEVAVSESGVMSFTAKCSVYPPCAGEVVAVNGDESTGYTVELRHSQSFTTILGGLSSVYCAQGDRVKQNLPLGYSKGEEAVRVTFYSDGAVLDDYTVNENGLAWV